MGSSSKDTLRQIADIETTAAEWPEETGERWNCMHLVRGWRTWNTATAR